MPLEALERRVLPPTTRNQRRFIAKGGQGIPTPPNFMDDVIKRRTAALKVTRPPPALMDEIHHWTFRQTTQATRNVTARYRSALRQAQRFVLDDDAVKLVCQLSHQGAARIEALSFLARLPYDHLWIEFNLHTKVDELWRMGTMSFKPAHDEISPVLGLLFYLDGSETRTRWVCHQFMRTCKTLERDDGKADWLGPSPLAMVFDPEGSQLQPIRGSALWRSPTLSLRPGFPKLPFRVKCTADGAIAPGNSPENAVKMARLPAKRIAPNVVELDQRVDPEININGFYVIDDDGVRTPDWLSNRAAVIVDPWLEAFCDSERINEIGAIEAHELSGMLRWTLTLLAAINGLPKDVKIMQSTGRQTVGMHTLPYFQHSTLAINLPREDRIRRARITLERLGRNAKRPWHEVIGHWRIVDRGKPLPGYYCHHLPTMVEHGLGICQKCEMLIRWIAPHERGDPNIGIVKHTYNIHGKRQAARVELGTAEKA